MEAVLATMSSSNSGPDLGAHRHLVMFILLKSVRKLGLNQAMIIDKHYKMKVLCT